MAESMNPQGGSQPLIGNRLLVTIASIVVFFVIVFLVWSMRGCIPSVSKDKGYTRIYSNLELSDTAKVIVRLKEIKIPYEVQDKGATISVPKERADEARLGLAEKNLPAGGMVGWEIFNETKMGATDFDRRIQLIRAISGELSRNIRRIAGVEDARVQIVIPETRLFEVTKSPVTAAVLIKLEPGAKLRAEQISGIVHLTASSVENLQPENVTVVDENGNILSKKAILAIGQAATWQTPEYTTTTETIQVQSEQRIIKKEEIKPAVRPEPTIQPEQAKTEARTLEAATTISKAPEQAKEIPRILTAEEKTLLKLKAREEYERQITAKIQDILNQFYPVNSVITKVAMDYGIPHSGKVAKLKIKTSSETLTQPIKRIKVFVLVDNRVNLTKRLKKNTYQTVADISGYNRARGDKIILKKVPFHYAVTPLLPMKQKISLLPMTYGMIVLLFAGAALILILIVVLIFRPKKEKPIPYQGRSIEEITAPPTEAEAISVIDEIKKTADENPERIANLLRKWLTEE